MSGAVVVSDWHLNDAGEWENAAGWIVRRGPAARRAAGMIWIGYRPAGEGRGDKVGGEFIGGWGETWAWSLEDAMQRVDRTSGAWLRIAEHSPALLPGLGRSLRAEAVAQLELGLGWEAA